MQLHFVCSMLQNSSYVREIPSRVTGFKELILGSRILLKNACCYSQLVFCFYKILKVLIDVAKHYLLCIRKNYGRCDKSTTFLFTFQFLQKIWDTHQCQLQQVK